MRRGVAASALCLLAALAGWGLAAPTQAGAAAGVPASQPVVVLLRAHVAHSRPSAGAHRVAYVSAHRPLTRVRTVLPVLGTATSPAGDLWVRVRLPGRPNGHAGWISTNSARLASTGWRLSLKLSARRLTVYRDGRAARHFRTVIGKPSTPTPRGHFFIEEALAIPGLVGGPFALATSARSNVLQEFEGGPGQIAIHGTGGLWGPLGSASSHGCIRLSAPSITWLARNIGSGVPLTIRR